ncbi:MAG: zinc ribbon domain-containing protein [Acidobacteria bacterium]|nr:zinc ribbon domain-containing protein [Acidobacteriota bacterium]
MKALRILSLAVFAMAAWSQTPPEQQWTPALKDEVRGKEGEVCLACRKPITAADKVYLVEGQRVPVHRANCDDVLRADPTRYLASLKPRGGLFGGETAPPGTVSDAWLLLGLYVILGLCFAAVCAHRALDQGHSPYLWFFVGLLLNAPGYLVLLARPPGPRNRLAAEAPAGLAKIPVTFAPRPCPMCGASNHPSAQECLECGAPLRPAVNSEVSRLRSPLN